MILDQRTDVAKIFFEDLDTGLMDPEMFESILVQSAIWNGET